MWSTSGSVPALLSRGLDAAKPRALERTLDSMTHVGLRPSMGFVSTYPPTSCGLATFTASLREAIAAKRGSDAGLGVVSLVEAPRRDRLPEVVHEHVNGDRESLRRAQAALNNFDVVSVQHEYGIFGHADGREVLDLLVGLDSPKVVTLHTVLTRPSPSQKSVLEQLAALTDRTIVMSKTAHRRLLDGYHIDPAKLRVVPHGAQPGMSGHTVERGTRPVVLTWGLIGPGKGLEMAIDAVADLRDLHPVPRYIILGATHPKVRAAHGDAYRDGLIRRAHDLGLEDVVEFDGRYLDVASLAAEIQQADVVVLPYESTEQVTSGVLVEAVAAGKPVVATAFPHAVELLSSGAGVTVPHDDTAALTTALRTVLTDDSLAARMSAAAEVVGSTLHWPVVARRYDDMAAALASRRNLKRASQPQDTLNGFASVS